LVCERQILDPLPGSPGMTAVPAEFFAILIRRAGGIVLAAASALVDDGGEVTCESWRFIDR
jgi:hypothetical protein